MEQSEKMARDFWHETMFPTVREDDLPNIEMLSDFFNWIKKRESPSVSG